MQAFQSLLNRLEREASLRAERRRWESIRFFPLRTQPRPRAGLNIGPSVRKKKTTKNRLDRPGLHRRRNPPAQRHHDLHGEWAEGQRRGDRKRQSRQRKNKVSTCEEKTTPRLPPPPHTHTHNYTHRPSLPIPRTRLIRSETPVRLPRPPDRRQRGQLHVRVVSFGREGRREKKGIRRRRSFASRSHSLSSFSCFSLALSLSLPLSSCSPTLLSPTRLTNRAGSPRRTISCSPGWTRAPRGTSPRRRRR